MRQTDLFPRMVFFTLGLLGLICFVFILICFILIDLLRIIYNSAIPSKVVRDENVLPPKPGGTLPPLAPKKPVEDETKIPSN